MSLKSLMLCTDEKIVRVLRRVLGDLDIAIEMCGDAESALRKLTRQRFEAIIADCAVPGSAEVLRSARSAPCNKQAIAIAVVDAATGLQSVFQIGAHFVLYKPVSSERAKASFRAARALMKRERRRNSRVPVQIPVTLRKPELDVKLKVNTVDLSEGGMAVSGAPRSRPAGRWQASFTLPGTEIVMESFAEFAWEGGGGKQSGLRFQDLAPEAAHTLREWLKRNSPDNEQDDPPVRCQLTDLSLGGCYLEIASPFPVSTRVTISMRAAQVGLRAEGIVRIMHPEKGMGVEFKQTTEEHRKGLEQFLGVLTGNRGLMPELLVEPEGLEFENATSTMAASFAGDRGSGSREESSRDESSGEESPRDEDALLSLFRTHARVAPENFLDALKQQRGQAVAAAV